jgi:hypothetical protein
MNAGEDLCLGSIYMIWKMRRKLSCTVEKDIRMRLMSAQRKMS